MEGTCDLQFFDLGFDDLLLLLELLVVLAEEHAQLFGVSYHVIPSGLLHEGCELVELE